MLLSWGDWACGRDFSPGLKSLRGRSADAPISDMVGSQRSIEWQARSYVVSKYCVVSYCFGYNLLSRSIHCYLSVIVVVVAVVASLTFAGEEHSRLKRYDCASRLTYSTIGTS